MIDFLVFNGGKNEIQLDLKLLKLYYINCWESVFQYRLDYSLEKNYHKHAKAIDIDQKLKNKTTFEREKCLVEVSGL